jgi:hypothetical protein
MNGDVSDVLKDACARVVTGDARWARVYGAVGATAGGAMAAASTQPELVRLLMESR